MRVEFLVDQLDDTHSDGGGAKLCNNDIPKSIHIPQALSEPALRAELEEQTQRLANLKRKAMLLTASTPKGNGIDALNTTVQALSESLERLGQRHSATRGWQSDLTTADKGKGKGKQKMQPALAPPNDGHSMEISHSSIDKIMQLTQSLAAANASKGKGKQKMEPALAPPNDGHSMEITHFSIDKVMQLTQFMAAAAGIKDSHPKSEDQAGPSFREERWASDSATANKAEESLDDKAAKRPPSSAGFDRDIHPTEDDLEELYRRDDPQ